MPRSFKTSYVWWIVAVFWGFILLLMCGAALNSSVPLAGRLVCGLIAVGVVVFLVRARRAGIEVDRSGVVVRKYSGRVIALAWGDVDSFALVSNGSFNNGVYVAVRAADGRVLKTQGLVAASSRSKSGLALVEALESCRPT